VKKVADFVNEAKRHAENAMKVVSIQETLIGKKAVNIVEPHRRFVSEASLTYYSAKKDRKPETLQYYLFNDCIVFAGQPKQNILGIGSNKQKKLRVVLIAMLAQSEATDVPDTSAMKNCFSFSANTKSGKSYLFALTSSLEKEEWIKQFYWLRSKASLRKEISNENLGSSKSEISLKSSQDPEKSPKLKKTSSKSLFSKKSSSPIVEPSEPSASDPKPSKEAARKEPPKLPERTESSPKIASPKELDPNLPRLPSSKHLTSKQSITEQPPAQKPNEKSKKDQVSPKSSPSPAKSGADDEKPLLDKPGKEKSRCCC